MYLSYYQLNLKPFQIAADPKFLCLGEKHKEALAILKYGIMDNRGFLLLTGDVGLGKTTLINALLESLDKNVIVATIPDPGLEKLDLFNYIADAFRFNHVFEKKSTFLIYLKSFLIKANHAGRKVLLIIDEAQRLTAELLEEIRILSNIEKKDEKLINIFFVGQNEFIGILNNNANRAIRQRITINYHIKPLGLEEVDRYVRHRLRIAGTAQRIFKPKAIKKIYALTKGCPRLINILCDRALLTGFVNDLKTISDKIIQECAQELDVAFGGSIGAKARRKNKSRAKNIRSAETMFLLGLVFAILAGCTYYYLVNAYPDFLEQVKQNIRQHAANVLLEAPPRHTEAPQQPDPPAPRATTDNNIDTVRPKPLALAPISSRPIPAPLSEANGKSRSPASSIDEPGTPVSDPAVSENAPMPATTTSRTALPAKELIYFKFNTNEMTPKSYDKLLQAYLYYHDNPDLDIVIKGYTDNIGNEKYNIQLSKYRAELVKVFLIGKGVLRGDIMAIGMGPKDPLAPNDTPEGRAKNRRVEIEFKY